MEKSQSKLGGVRLTICGWRTLPFAALAIILVTFSVPALSMAQPSGSSNASVSSSNTTASLPPGLIGYWAAEGDARDSVGTNHGSLRNGAGFADGIAGYAFDFDGRGSYVYIPGSESLNVGKQVTVELWMKPDPSNTMQTYQGLVASDFYIVEFANGYGRPHIGVHFGISTDGGATVPFPQTADANNGGFPVSPGVWHHIAGTYDGTKLQLYVDGQPAGNPLYHTGTISPMWPGNGIAIGSEERTAGGFDPSSGRFFHGLIDEVAIYNRALSPSEVFSRYNAGIEGRLPSPAVSPGPPAATVSKSNSANSASQSAGSPPSH